MTVREPECVALKRRGAELVANQLLGKSLREQVDFWQRLTESLLAKQATARAPKEEPFHQMQ